MRAADLAKAGVIVHGKVIIAAETKMERRWADHPPATSACGCDMAINSGPRFNSVTKRGQWLLPDLKEVFWRGFCEGEQGEAETSSSNLSAM